MDNKIFNVNGGSKKQLELAVKSLMTRDNGEDRTAEGWYFSEDKGLVFTWYLNDKTTPFTDNMGIPKEISASELIEVLWDWLEESDDATKVKHTGWDIDSDHDGHNVLGWRLYTEDWGHVGSDPYAIGAIKPAYLWMGK